MGNASFGNQRQELEPGDYLAQVTDVGLEDFEDPQTGKTRPTFAWSVDVQLPDGNWESRKVFTSRRFTDMRPRNGKPVDPKFVSGLNKLVRACGKPVPQTDEAAGKWNENDLVGSQFTWRVEVDEETGATVRKFVAVRPQGQAPAPVAAKAQNRELAAVGAGKATPDPFEDE